MSIPFKVRVHRYKASLIMVFQNLHLQKTQYLMHIRRVLMFFHQLLDTTAPIFFTIIGVVSLTDKRMGKKTGNIEIRLDPVGNLMNGASQGQTCLIDHNIQIQGHESHKQSMLCSHQHALWKSQQLKIHLTLLQRPHEKNL